MIKTVKKDERIKELEEAQSRYSRMVLDLNLEIARRNCLIENLETKLGEERKKYMELLERYIAMMEKVVGNYARSDIQNI